MSINLTQQLKQIQLGSIDHMTHIENLDSIFEHGLLAHNNQYKKIDISNKEVNTRRAKKESIYNKPVHDYVPFYLNPRNAMMYANKNKDVVILAFDIKLILEDKVLFTNKNASADNVNFYYNLKDLIKLDWNNIWSESWYDKIDSYNIKQAMMAEVLVYKRVSLKFLKVIVCKDEYTKKKLEDRYWNYDIKFIVNKKQFFK